jgi:DNA polymerase III subunit delta'
MARPPSREAPPESDRFAEAPHPRRTHVLFGQTAAESALLEAYRSDRMPQSWILGGREGIGKATLAWRLTKFLLTHPDPHAESVRAAQDLSAPEDHPAVRRVAALSHDDVALLRRQWNDKSKRHFTEIRIDEVRSALDLFRRASGEGGWRICLVDCAEDLNRSSANALLKLVEEPPARSLFLFVAHQPGRMLATLRSRSRMLLLEPLGEADALAALRAAGPPWSDAAAADLVAAARRGGGSAREAMRLLAADGLKLMDQLERLFDGLPRVDWRAVQAIADVVATRDGEDAFRAFLGACQDWLDARIHGGGSPNDLIGYAEAWDKLAEGARDVVALNLDKRPFVLSVFSDLARAAEGLRV